MKNAKLQFKMQNLINPLIIIFFAVVLRLLPHPPNFAPITAMALFGGVYLNKKYALIVPLIAMFFSDIFLGFHDTMPFVYGSFIISGLIGLWLKKHKTAPMIIGGAVSASLLFFFITNFGSWAVGTLYPKTIAGLVESYIMGLPFLRNTLLGDMFYTGVFFLSFEAALQLVKKPVLSRTAKKTA